MSIRVSMSKSLMLGHFMAGILHFPMDGFSPPYQVALAFSGFFYALLGMLFLRKVLLGFFSEQVTAFTLLCIGAGTNLSYYAIYEGAMSHAANFCLFSLFIFLTLKWHEKRSFIITLLLGLCFTLITLVRASNMVILILPLLYGITNRKTFLDKVHFLKGQRKNIIIVSGICFLLFIPQLLYWKFVSGHYFFYSYGEETFYFSRPHIINGFFSYRKGWLLYTPMMAFGLLGLFFLRKRTPFLFVPISVFVVLNSWIVLSWWCWWYGGSFGMRSFVESYALLAIPFACFVELAFRKWWSMQLIITPVVFFIMLNNFQSDQARNNLIHYDSMSKGLYWKVFLRNQWPVDFDKLLKHPDYEKATHGIPEDE